MLKNIKIEMPSVPYRHTIPEEFIYNTETQTIESLKDSFVLRSIFNKKNFWAIKHPFLLLLALFFRYIMIDNNVSSAPYKRKEILHLFKSIARQCWS